MKSINELADNTVEIDFKQFCLVYQIRVKL